MVLDRAIPGQYTQLESAGLLQKHIDLRRKVMQIRQLRKEKMNMKILLRAGISLAVAAMFFTTAIAYSKSQDKRLLVEGSLQGTEVDVLQGSPPDSIAVDGNIPGLATHLGEFTYSYKVLVSIQDGSATGTGELIAANGDRVFLSITGQGEPIGTDVPNLNSIVEIDSITGGTGRFAGAIGGVTVRRLIDLATGFTSGSIHGTVVLAGGRHGDH
jgi:hypothetical protein